MSWFIARQIESASSFIAEISKSFYEVNILFFGWLLLQRYIFSFYSCRFLILHECFCEWIVMEFNLNKMEFAVFTSFFFSYLQFWLQRWSKLTAWMQLNSREDVRRDLLEFHSLFTMTISKNITKNRVSILLLFSRMLSKINMRMKELFKNKYKFRI